MPPAYFALVAALLVVDAALSTWRPSRPHALRSALALGIAYLPALIVPSLPALAISILAALVGCFGFFNFARLVGLTGRSFTLALLSLLSFYVAAKVHWYDLFEAMPVFVMFLLAGAATVRAEPQAFLQKVSLSWLGILVYGYLLAHAALFTDTDLGSLPPGPVWIAAILVCAKSADVAFEIGRKLGPRADDLQIVLCVPGGALGGAALHLVFPAALTAPQLTLLGALVGLGMGAASRVYKLIVTDVLGANPLRPMKGTMLFGFAFALALAYHYIRHLA